MSEIKEFDFKVQSLINEGYEFRTSDYFKRGNELFKQDSGLFIGYTCVYFLIIMIAGMVVPFAANILAPPLAIGFYLVFQKVRKGESREFGDFFKGFDKIGPLILVSLVSGMFISLGIILLIIPGIYLAVAYAIADKLVYFRNYEFWTAMEASRKLVSKQLGSWFWFFTLIFLINLAGALPCGLGLIWTIPYTMGAVFAAYEDVLGLGDEEEQQGPDLTDHFGTGDMF